MFDIIWVNSAKNQEERRKHLPVTGENLDKQKRLFPRKHSFELWLKSTNYTGKTKEWKIVIKEKLTFWFVKTKPK